MSEKRWSPEPWSTESCNLLSADGMVFGGPEWEWEKEPRGEDPPDAVRIVACVNACAGIPTEALESGALGEALDLLASIEWVDTSGDEYNACCPVCGGVEPVRLYYTRDRTGEGHTADCRWVETLRRLWRLP